MGEATKNRRKRGRRAAPPRATTVKHLKLVRAANKKLTAARAEEIKQANLVAKRVKSAVGSKTLSTASIAKILGVSQPMVYKLMNKAQGRALGPKKATQAKTWIKEAHTKHKSAKTKVQSAKKELAKKIDRATSVGVETNAIASEIALSRQMVYKLIAECIDGKTLNKKG